MEVKQITAPPDYLYQNRQDRINPQNAVMGEGWVTYIPKETHFIEGKGIFVEWEGVPFWSKGIASKEAIYAISMPKRVFIEAFKMLANKSMILPLMIAFLFKRQKNLRLACEYLINVADLTMFPFYIQEEYEMAIAKEIRIAIKEFLKGLGVAEDLGLKVGKIIGSFIEYDNAYRYRLQDIMMEINKEKLLKDFPSEVNRMLRILAEREVGNLFTIEKFATIGKVLTLSWKIPFIKKAIKASIQTTNFDNMKLDEADLYHTYLYGDYNVGGLSFKERIEKLREIHGEDESKWPPRILTRF